MALFLGMAIGSIFLPYLSDKYGRRGYFLLCLGVQETCILFVVFMPGHWVCAYVVIGLMFLLGIFMGGRIAIGYCMMVDFTPKSYHKSLGIIWGIFEASIYLLLTLYF